jgi:hypothetical protein
MLVDPLAADFPWVTPFNYAENSPIAHIDLWGLQAFPAMYGQVLYDAWKSGGSTAMKETHKGMMQAHGTGVGIAATVVTGGALYEAAPFAAIYVANNPAVVQTSAAVLWGAFTDQDFPGSGVDNTVKAGRHLLLGRSRVIVQYSDEMTDVNHMFKRGFGLDIPRSLPLKEQLSSAMNITVTDGGKLLFDLTDVSVDAAKAGFQSFDAAADASKIAEWELSTILRNEELYNNTFIRQGDEVKPLSQSGIEFIGQ